MRLVDQIQQNVQKFAIDQYGKQIDSVEIQPTKKDHDADLTVVVFPLLRFIKSKPADLADALGTYLENQIEEIKAYHVIQGFLNLIIDDVYYLRFLSDIQHPENFGIQPVTADSKKILVEYSSPNTNKPLHPDIFEIICWERPYPSCSLLQDTKFTKRKLLTTGVSIFVNQWSHGKPLVMAKLLK